MQRLLTLIADKLRPGTQLIDLMINWPGDRSSRGASLPLRLAGSLHALVLDGSDAALAATYPPHEVDDEALWRAVENALRVHANQLAELMQSPPQTNEVRRAAALIPVGHLLAQRFGLPLCLSEIGASGGLNLNFDQFGLEVSGQHRGHPRPVLTLRPDWRGALPEATPFTVAQARGCDLNPLTGPDNLLRLRAYLWPDQPARRALTDAAIAAGSQLVDKADAADWLPHRLKAPMAGQTHLIYHTIAWQYLPAKAQHLCKGAILDAGLRASADAPLAWMGMEADDEGDGAALTLTLWPGNGRMSLGRADFHGRWIDWRPQWES